MPAYALVNFLIYCLVNSFTPGPGNILALNTVTNYGWKKGKPLFFGIFAGYYAVQFLCALVVYGVNAMLPGVMGVIKYVGAAYILWLAVHIALSRPDLDQGEQSASFWKGFVLQFVNVKIYMFGITALTGYIVPYTAAPGPDLIIENGISGLLCGTVPELAAALDKTTAAMGHAAQSRVNENFLWQNSAELALTLLECVYGILK